MVYKNSPSTSSWKWFNNSLVVCQKHVLRSTLWNNRIAVSNASLRKGEDFLCSMDTVQWESWDIIRQLKESIDSLNWLRSLNESLSHGYLPLRHQLVTLGRNSSVKCNQSNMQIQLLLIRLQGMPSSNEKDTSSICSVWKLICLEFSVCYHWNNDGDTPIRGNESCSPTPSVKATLSDHFPRQDT